MRIGYAIRSGKVVQILEPECKALLTSHCNTAMFTCLQSWRHPSVAVNCRALLKSGDHVICVHPAYQSLYEIAQNIGCAVDFWQLRSDDSTGRLHFDVSPLVKPSILSLR